MSSARSPEKCCLGDARPAHLWRFPLQNLLCPECGDEFALQSQLAVHMEAHRQELAGARPHTCKACKKEFGASSELKEHMKAHCKIRYAPSWSSGAPGSWRSRGLPAASHVKGFSAVAAGSHTADASQHGSARVVPGFRKKRWRCWAEWAVWAAGMATGAAHTALAVRSGSWPGV